MVIRKINSKKPADKAGGLFNGESMCRSANGGACNALDVRAGDTEIIQFAIGHPVQFDDGLTILAPGCKRTSNVHGLFLPWGPATLLAASSSLTTVICCIAAMIKRNCLRAPMRILHGGKQMPGFVHEILTVEFCRRAGQRSAVSRASGPWQTSRSIVRMSMRRWNGYSMF